MVPKMSRKVDFEENALSLGGPWELSPHTGHGTGHVAVVLKNLLSACGEFSLSNDSSGLLHRGPNASGPNIRTSSSVEGVLEEKSWAFPVRFYHFQTLLSSKEQ